MLSTTKLIAQAVGSFLHYEYALGRGGMFSERYLTTPVSQALQYKYKCGVTAEHKHPSLKGAGGSYPRVDFAAVTGFPKALAVVETKWTNHANISRQAILWDLLRLELVARADNAEAFFVLAGERSMITKISTYKWSDGQRAASFLPFGKAGKIQVKGAVHVLGESLQRRFDEYPEVEFPCSLHLKSPYAYPQQVNEDQKSSSAKYQVFVWQLNMDLSSRERFVPSAKASVP
ncbi:hypothetical protein IB238_23425 [Rhizobium sp. ARZ01]|uniref:hypothetical protein n=1 Tax=Rhizobium sp. ARZ01 TaxID=2769313 RepID=UPI00177E0EEC|nr:hypothetical protein [Rhizobium sp. ARZ01]MBD9375565.1 hypothetical protein [Rhizobium sp. ARZ01]